MGHNIIWFTGQQFHLEESEDRVDVMKFIHNGLYRLVFLDYELASLARCRDTWTNIEDYLTNRMFIGEIFVVQIEMCCRRYK